MRLLLLLGFALLTVGCGAQDFDPVAPSSPYGHYDPFAPLPPGCREVAGIDGFPKLSCPLFTPGI